MQNKLFIIKYYNILVLTPNRSVFTEYLVKKFKKIVLGILLLYIIYIYINVMSTKFKDRLNAKYIFLYIECFFLYF